jgi:Sulfotransferase family
VIFLLRKMSMVISHKYKFIFIKTGKTAGTSIEVFLSSVCASADILTPIYPHVEPHLPRNHEGFYNRMSAHEIRSIVGYKIWNEYFKFCVERNPWDKTVSYYHMAKAKYGSDLTMNEYLKTGELPINYLRYTEKNDPRKIIVDQVVLYEDLIQGLQDVFNRIGIPFSGSIGVNAKSEYRKERRPYQEIFTSEQATFIRQAYLPEIELHGYKYE